MPGRSSYASKRNGGATQWPRVRRAPCTARRSTRSCARAPGRALDFRTGFRAEPPVKVNIRRPPGARQCPEQEHWNGLRRDRSKGFGKPCLCGEVIGDGEAYDLTIGICQKSYAALGPATELDDTPCERDGRWGMLLGSGCCSNGGGSGCSCCRCVPETRGFGHRTGAAAESCCARCCCAALAVGAIVVVGGVLFVIKVVCLREVVVKICRYICRCVAELGRIITTTDDLRAR